MQIINKDVNGILAEASHIPMLGIASSGVARVILAIMQVALNIFLFVPSLFLSCCVDEDSSLHIGNVVSDVFNPIAHIIRGIIECGLPGSCFILGST